MTLEGSLISKEHLNHAEQLLPSKVTDDILSCVKLFLLSNFFREKFMSLILYVLINLGNKYLLYLYSKQMFQLQLWIKALKVLFGYSITIYL